MPGQKMFDWGAMKKEKMKIGIFEGHFDGIPRFESKQKFQKEAKFFLIS
jgi:hypothetical protein